MTLETTSTSTQTTDGLASVLKRTEIQHSSSSIQGREIVQVLTEIPVGRLFWVAHPPRRGGRLHPGRSGADGDP